MPLKGTPDLACRGRARNGRAWRTSPELRVFSIGREKVVAKNGPVFLKSDTRRTVAVYGVNTLLNKIGFLELRAGRVASTRPT